MSSTASRGRAGVIGFVIAEASLFAVFVVAYLFYIGKSLTGPYPRDILELPIVGTICLLSSSITVALATRALAAARVGRAGMWLLVTVVLGLTFLAGTAQEWRRMIRDREDTSANNVFGIDDQPLVGLHAS